MEFRLTENSLVFNYYTQAAKPWKNGRPADLPFFHVIDERAVLPKGKVSIEAHFP